MPAYSYQERFVPMVLDGSKTQTIRTRRKKGFAKKGDTLYHYFGMRTKWCRKLKEAACTDVRTVIIVDGSLQTIQYSGPVIFLFDRRLDDQEFFYLDNGNISLRTSCYSKILKGLHADRFAWEDGFRPEESSRTNPGGSFALMSKWWAQTHQLPLIGDVIYWGEPQLLAPDPDLYFTGAEY